MATGPDIVATLERRGFTHVVWIPDSEVGQWDAALAASAKLRLIRPTREGEAIAIAGGLCLGGATPLLIIQCTGLFEAGDSLRNFVHDLKLPLVFVIGLRSYTAHKQGRSIDTCPVYTEPILQAWKLPYTVLDRGWTAAQLEAALKQVQDSGRAGAVVLAE
jgi:sulfopyruvate decarboxylase TPP-binding subunit